MYRYDIFGGRLHSEEAFPELLPAPEDDRPPDWSASRAPELARTGGKLLGTEVLSSESQARLFLTSAGYRLEVDRIGDFEVSTAGDRLRYRPASGASVDFVRSHLLGRVMGIALDRQGVLTLHGSAVDTGSGAIGFVAPKYSGKSTLAAAIVQRGCGLINDDTLAVRLADGPSLLPGVPAVRLGADSVAKLALGESGPLTRDGKFVLRDFGPDSVVRKPAPLATVYVLQPVEADPGAAPAFRESLAGPQAALALTGHSRVGALLGSANAARLLQQIAELTRNAEVFALGVARDAERLGEVCDQILGWHRS